MTPVLPATRGRLAVLILLTTSLAAPLRHALGQRLPTDRPLTLADAWARAEAKSDEITVAEAQREQARGAALQVGSARRPHLSAYSAYDRTLRSEFDGITGFAPDSAASGDPSAEIPFGSAHAYRAGLTASYVVFAGGRSISQTRAAASARRAAEIGATTVRAQLRLDVTQAYYEAILANHLVQLSAWTLEQAESTYRRVASLADAGRAAEFDVVRAKAARERGRPVVIQREAEREIALLRLRQLLHVPATAELSLPTDWLGAAPAALDAQTRDGSPRPSTDDRTAVREAAALVVRAEQLAQASQAGRLPSVALTSTYERVAYPLDGTPSWRSSRANWTVGARVDLPIMSGGHQQGSDAIARAEVDAARARLRLTRQAAELDARSSAARLAAAEATLTASAASVDEANRAYAIAQLRYREGISIQLELSDARLGLEQARADQARAARDVSIERVRATLLSDLPLSASAGTASAATGRTAP